MLSIDKLIEFGADTKTGLMRCMDSEDFYLRMVGLLRKENNFDVLDEALQNNDLDRAFEAAHALKGVTGNLALTGLFEPISELTELLRSRTEMDYSEYREKVLAKKQELFEMIDNAE